MSQSAICKFYWSLALYRMLIVPYIKRAFDRHLFFLIFNFRLWNFNDTAFGWEKLLCIRDYPSLSELTCDSSSFHASLLYQKHYLQHPRNHPLVQHNTVSDGKCQTVNFLTVYGLSLLVNRLSCPGNPWMPQSMTFGWHFRKIRINCHPFCLSQVGTCYN